jgi:hypothetical protein
VNLRHNKVHQSSGFVIAFDVGQLAERGHSEGHRGAIVNPSPTFAVHGIPHVQHKPQETLEGITLSHLTVVFVEEGGLNIVS